MAQNTNVLLLRLAHTRVRILSSGLLAIIALITSSCGGGGPSGRDIDNSLEATLHSVAGGWVGLSTSPPNAIRLEFQLQEGLNGQVSGAGTMKEDSTPAPVPITVSGTFQRPVLALIIDGIVVESRPVKGVVQGNYVTVGGIGATLKLTAQGYARDVPILLQEK